MVNFETFRLYSDTTAQMLSNLDESSLAGVLVSAIQQISLDNNYEPNEIIFAMLRLGFKGQADFERVRKELKKHEES